MTPKEKAMYLIAKYINKDTILNATFDSIPELIKGKMNFKSAKECALIAVDEMLNMITSNDVDVWDIDILNYWQGVKQEIQKL